jgi:ankyrin repeat protein
MNQFVAANNGSIQQLRRVLTVDNVDDVNGVGRTALHYSSHKGSLECIKYCIKMGVNVNARDFSAWTPLHFASSYGYTDIVHVLLDASAIIVDAKTNTGKTPLYNTIKRKHVRAKLLIDRGAKVANVQLDKTVPTIPDWVNAIIASRSKCRSVAALIIGIHKYRHTKVTGNNDMNVLKMIAKLIWSSRMDDMW